jgi:uncharacterized membrane protein
MKISFFISAVPTISDMNKMRLEAFSDGVIAIILTIMVLELKTPITEGPKDILQMLYGIGTYLLSFIFVATFWVNHYHVIHTIKFVVSKIIWANILLLFSLSLIPFATRWMVEKHFDSLTVASYSLLLLICSAAFYVLQRAIISDKQVSEKLQKALESQSVKGAICLLLYIIAIPFAYWHVSVSIGIFVFQAVWWAIPNKDIESSLKEQEHI